MLEYLIVAEDEPSIAHALNFGFKEDFELIDTCTNGLEVLKMIHKRRPNILLLDWSLPGRNGLDICRDIRKDPDFFDLPIIMVTAHTEIVDAVLSLELGVDDYVRKPFEFKELQARVHAVLRRREAFVYNRSMLQQAKNIMCFDKLQVDVEKAEAFLAGQNLELTNIEFKLLKLLATQPAKTFSRNEILDRVWDESYMGNPRAVDVYIRHLRQKLESHKADHDYIKTVRGRGWRLT
jgi:DNA-binding response OmpR family regulator